MARAGNDCVGAPTRERGDSVMARPPSRLDLRQIGGRDARRAFFNAARKDDQRLIAEGWMDRVKLPRIDVWLVPLGREAGELRPLRLPHARKRL